MMVWRTIRGMIHQKSARGQEALGRLSTFEGIPEPYDKTQRVVIPAALRVMRLKPGRDYTVMGDLAHSVGWKHRDLLKRLESKRKAESLEHFKQKKAAFDLRKKAKQEVKGEVAKINQQLEKYGF
jgi:large subunit ribosomal protein L13Ae